MIIEEYEDKSRGIRQGYLIHTMTATQILVFDLLIGLLEKAFSHDDKRLNNSVFKIFNSRTSDLNSSSSCAKAQKPYRNYH